MSILFSEPVDNFLFSGEFCDKASQFNVQHTKKKTQIKLKPKQEKQTNKNKNETKTRQKKQNEISPFKFSV